MEDKLKEKVNEKIQHILDEDINTNNLEPLYKLTKIKHMIKEDENMYNDYRGRNVGYDNYGRGYRDYNEGYNARGYDRKYRGYGHLDRMYNEYGNYGGRRPGYDSYGRYYGEYSEGNYGNYGRGSYGRRGRDMKYRGDDYMDRMSEEYGRYMESRERYGANDQETDKSFHYMTKALEDFIKVLYEEAETPNQKQELMQVLQNSMR